MQIRLRTGRELCLAGPVREPPLNVSDDDVLAAVREHWTAEVDGVEHLPVGFGAHHWAALRARPADPLRDPRPPGRQARRGVAGGGVRRRVRSDVPARLRGGAGAVDGRDADGAASPAARSR